MLGQNRLQARGAHLNGLLHHVIQPRRLEWGEQVMQVGRRGLRPGLSDQGHPDRALAGFGDLGLPLAIAPVEQKDALPGFEPQDVGQVMALRMIERNARPCRERSIYIKPRAPEVVARHVPILVPIRPAGYRLAAGKSNPQQAAPHYPAARLSKAGRNAEPRRS